MVPMSGCDIRLLFTLPPRENWFQYVRREQPLTFLALLPWINVSIKIYKMKPRFSVFTIKNLSFQMKVLEHDTVYNTKIQFTSLIVNC